MIVGVIGLGLMGASFCLALKKNNHIVYGADICEQTQEYAKSNGIIDDFLCE